MIKKTCTKCSESKCLNEFSKHSGCAHGVSSICKACTSARGIAWHAANRDRSLANKLKYREANREAINDMSRVWRLNNKERCKEVAAKWTKNNLDKKAASTTKRRASLLMATPAWADLNAMKLFYKWAKEATLVTGVVFEVDHIYPLQGKDVCGLHCWENLALLTRDANRRKGNKSTFSNVTLQHE